MKKLTVLLAVVSVVALAFMGCVTAGVIANSEGYDIKNSSGDKPVQPAWTKNPEVRDAESMKIFRIKGPSSEYTKLDAAMANLDGLAHRRISEYIDKTIKIKDEDLQWTTTENGNISGGENATSFIEAYTDVKLRSISMERYYWELAKGKEPYYTAWGEFSIPNDAIEDARRFIAEKESEENYRVRKTEDDNKRFHVLRNDFSREIEPFFKDAGRRELFFVDPQKYQARYSHLMEIKAHLENFGSLKGQTGYQDFAFTIKEMVETYEPTEMLVMSSREQNDRLRQEYEGKYRQYETKIAGLVERNNALKDEKDEVFALFNKLSEELQQHPAAPVLIDSLDQGETIAQLEKRNKALDEVFALLNKLSEELQQRPADPILIDSLDQGETIAQLEERNKALDEVFALLNKLSEELQQRPAAPVLIDSLDQKNNVQGVDQYQGEYIQRAIELIFSWQVPSGEELAKAEKYRVKKGDTLVIIARRRYGSSLYFPWVYRCNRNVISNWDLIHTDEILSLPNAPGSIDSLFTAR